MTEDAHVVMTYHGVTMSVTPDRVQSLREQGWAEAEETGEAAGAEDAPARKRGVKGDGGS